MQSKAEEYRASADESERKVRGARDPDVKQDRAEAAMAADDRAG
jgi:hypothetical protein